MYCCQKTKCDLMMSCTVAFCQVSRFSWCDAMARFGSPSKMLRSASASELVQLCLSGTGRLESIVLQRAACSNCQRLPSLALANAVAALLLYLPLAPFQT